MKSILFCLFAALSATAQLKAVNYADGDQKLIGFAGQPQKAAKNKAGVLILPAWKGIDNHAKESAQQLAELGYYTFVADIYGEGHYPKNTAEAGTQAGYYKEHYKDYQRRISLALAELVKSGADPNRIVVMGYCFGGTGALEAARGGLPVQGVVSFHGGLKKDASRPNSPISAKVLALHGADDPYVPAAEVTEFQNEMRACKADWQLNMYANAVHAFTDKEAGTDNSQGAAYNEKADKRSWENFLDFLRETLK